MDSKPPIIKISQSDLTQSECVNENFGNFQTPKIDRYIPNRSLNDLDKSHHYLVENKHSFHKILNFSTNSIPTSRNIDRIYQTPSKMSRKVNTQSFLVLDAPSVEDNFYLNLLDWSPSSILAVGLGQEIFLWNHRTNSSSELSASLKQSADSVSSIKWIGDEQLVFGNHCGIQLWDVNSQKCITTFKQSNKITCIDLNDRILTSSSFMDKKILYHDLRVKKIIGKFTSQENICSIKWNPNGRFLAIGGSQGSVYVRDIFSGLQDSQVFDTLRGHCSSLKALCWCPWQSSLLASGGGLFDKKINFWNIYSSKKLKTLQVQSQIASIVWSKQFKEILYTDFDDLVICKFPSMDKTAEIREHSGRVLSVAMSKDEIVASIGADETIRFWNFFKASDSKPSPISIRKLDYFQNIR